jgi:hypothetical protein
VMNEITFLAQSNQGFLNIQPIWALSWVVCSHYTSSGAAEPFHGLDMWPTRVVLLWNQLTAFCSWISQLSFYVVVGPAQK